MDLFTYLMGKNDKNLLPHSDLFSYLLGKNNSKPYTASGVEITFLSKKGKLNSLELSKESTQDGTPTPDNPIPVNTIKGYRNLFDNTMSWSGTSYGKVNYNSNDDTFTFHRDMGSDYLINYGTLNLEPSTQYKLYFDVIENTMTDNFRSVASNNYLQGTFSIPAGQTGVFSATLNTGSSPTTYDLWLYCSSTGTLKAKIMLVKGNVVLPYVPYGTNWIYIKDTNGVETKYLTIPLNNNEICGIGDYKDELIIDKQGHCYLNKKTGKVVLNGSENWGDYQSSPEGCYRAYTEDVKIGLTSSLSFDTFLCDYFGAKAYAEMNSINITKYATYLNIDNTIANSTTELKNWLSTHNTTLYYALAESNLIDLNYTVDMTIYKGTNTITNSEDAPMIIEYF